MNPTPEAGEAQPKTEVHDQSEEVVHPDHPPVVDEFLWSYVKRANSGIYDGVFTLTLFVRGRLISGQLISERSYLSRIAMLLSKDAKFPKLNEADLAKCRRIMHDDILSHALEQELYGSDVDANYHIHLSDIAILNGDDWVKGDLWRGSLSSIDGFLWGGFTRTMD
jgi:hypothetical protein